MQDQELKDCQELLASGIETLGINIPPDQQSQLIEYLVLLSRWNKTFNLTAVREPRQMVIKHLLDSLTVVEYLQGDRVLDVGSGAGIPGIILAIILAC